MALLDWKHTAEPGFEQEAIIMADFGLVKNENIYGTDLYCPYSDTYVEVKSIASHKIAVVRGPDGKWMPRFMYFQVTRKARQKGYREPFPLLRPGSVFRTCIETPNALIVVRCPRKVFWKDDVKYTVPARAWFYKAHHLMFALTALINTNKLAVFRLYPDRPQGLFETLVKVEFSALKEHELTRHEFRKCLETGITGVPQNTAIQMWQELVAKKSIPALRTLKLYESTLKGYLQADPEPMWKPVWWLR